MNNTFIEKLIEKNTEKKTQRKKRKSKERIIILTKTHSQPIRSDIRRDQRSNNHRPVV
jgi:hypothetical protein